MRSTSDDGLINYVAICKERRPCFEVLSVTKAANVHVDVQPKNSLRHLEITF